ncbi:MAG: PKD domain-containing protein [Bacteroidales bacterium]
MPSPVNILQVNSGNVFIGGSFVSIEGQNRDRVGEVDLTTGQPTAWNPGADMYVNSLFHDNNTVFIGGVFTQVGGQDRQSIAAIDAASGAVKAWNPGTSSRVFYLKVLNDDLFVGGDFSSIGGVARRGLAVVDKNTAVVSSWDPKIGGSVVSVYAVDFYDDRILVGGLFSSVDSEKRQNLAVYSLFYSIQYLAGENGTLSGETVQYVKPGQNGSEITAIPDVGYHFVRWSDDVTNNPRTDLNVNTDIEVTAIFERTPPVADFEADITYTEVPGVISFTDQSLNIPESWEWDFGDGNTSTEQNPTHEYTVQGIYTVSLTVTNSAGSDNLIKSDYIIAEQCSNGLIGQTDWSGGPGQADVINDSTMFDTSVNIDFSSVQGQLSGSFSSSESDMATFFYNGKLYNARSYGLMTMDTVTNQWNYEVKITGLNNAAKVTIMNDTLYVLTGWSIYYTDGSSDDFGMGNNGWRLHSVLPSTNLQGAYSLGSFQGQLYVGVRNNSSQGYVYRYNGNNWSLVGGQVSVVPTKFFEYNNELYVGTHWSAAIYKKTTADTWSYQYAPSSMMYVSDFVEFQGSLYAAVFKNTYYNGVIVRFNGSTWSTVFSGPGCYSLAVADNVMYVSTQNSTGGAGQILQTTNGSSYTTAYVLTPDEARAVLASDGKKLYHGTVNKSGTFSSNFYIDKQIAFNYLNASLKSSYFPIQSPAFLTANYDADLPQGTGFAVLLQGKEDGSDWNVNRFYKPLLNGSSMMFHDDLYRYEIVLWTTEPALSPVINDITLTQTGEVLTTGISSIDYHSAESGGSVDIYCTHAINSKGIVWSTSQEPTVENNMGMTNEGSNFDEFTSFMSGLNHNTDYFVRAYASTDYVTIYGQQHSFKTLTHAPVVDFEADIISGPAPLDVCFTDLSTYDPETWEWDFGDSSVSSLQNPCHTYVGIGTYTVSLIVENTGGNDTLIKTNYINVVKPDVINGDVNNDGLLNVLDVVWFVDYLNEFVHEDFNIYAADVNDDLTIDVSDFTLLLDHIYNGD